MICVAACSVEPHCVLEQFLLSSLFRLWLSLTLVQSVAATPILETRYSTQLICQNYTMCREDTTLTQAMHEMRGSGDIKLVLCISLMLSKSVSQQEKLSLEGCNSSGLLISRNKLAEIPTLLECSNVFLVASFTCVPKVLQLMPSKEWNNDYATVWRISYRTCSWTYRDW